jgi:ABC-type dipeptide/oligopeptide/nickel transport system permease component
VRSSFVAFVLRRLLAALGFVAVVATSAFVLTHFAPEVRDPNLTEADYRKERARLGLDHPLYVQLAAWFDGLAHFNLGTSQTKGEPVVELLSARAANTAELAGAALGLATVVGLPLGLLTAARPRGALATLVVPISVALISCPPIVGGLALSLLALRTGWLSLGHLALPALALALPLAAALERLQSQATAETLAAPDLLAAAARGVPPSRLLWSHAARQSLRPVLGVYGIVIGSLFSGSLAVEFVTAWPGLGRLMYEALVARDLFLVSGCALLGAMFLAFGNFVADLARAAVDPRVRERT